MVGDAQPVDVFEQLDSQPVQRFLASPAEAGDGSALRSRRNDDDDQPDQAERRDHTDVDLACPQATVDGLLDQDRDDDSTRGADHGQRERGPEPTSQGGRGLDALADHLDG